MRVIARGREAEVLDAGPGRVLRRYLDGRDVTAEVALHRHVLDHGFPVPRDVAVADGGMLMERVPGPTLLAAFLAGEVDADGVAAVLADLHRRLHALPVPPGPGVEPGERVVHLDLHPANVLLSPRGPVVVDWASGRVGHPDLDVGLTSVVLAEVVVAGVDAGAGDVAAVDVPREVVREALAAFLAADHGAEPCGRLDDVVAWRTVHGPGATPAAASAALVRSMVVPRPA